MRARDTAYTAQAVDYGLGLRFIHSVDYALLYLSGKYQRAVASEAGRIPILVYHVVHVL